MVRRDTLPRLLETDRPPGRLIDATWQARAEVEVLAEMSVGCEAVLAGKREHAIARVERRRGLLPEEMAFNWKEKKAMVS